MRAAYALRINSGIIILNFGVQKRLRAFLDPIFTGRCRSGKRQLQRWFPAETVALRGSAPSHKGRAFGSPHKLHLFAKASPFGRGGSE